MPYVEDANFLYDSNYELWKEIINSTCYFNHDDDDVCLGKLTQDWHGHKEGAYVVYPCIARNGAWIAVENLGPQGEPRFSLLFRYFRSS